MASFEVDTRSMSQVARLVRFATGKINPQVKDTLQIKCYCSDQKDSSGKQPMAVAAQCNGMNYLGKNHGPSSHFTTDSCDYYVGIQSKKSNKIRVMPAELFLLHPQLEKDDTEVKASDSQLTPAKSREMQKMDLTKSFGSGKIQRKLVQREKLKLEEDMISTTSEHIARTSAPHTASESPAAVESAIVPPYNKDATRPEDIFKLHEMISPEALAGLVDHCQVFFDCTAKDILAWKTEETYFGLVLNSLETLSHNAAARLLQCQCLMYMQYLLTVYLMKSTDLRKKYPLPSDWPQPVKHYILDHFTFLLSEKPLKRLAPPRLKDLLLSHILVFGLKLNQFSVDLELLATDLKMTVKRLMTHATAIGCKIKKRANGTFATLSVPYTPKEIVARKQSRKSM